jgi:dienelactone hydrolase
MHRVLTVLLVLAAASGAGAAPVDPGKPGRFAVGVATVEAIDSVRERFLPTEIWYPAKTAGRDATPLKKSYPLILMAHGLCGSRLNYEYLTTHLASHGFVVAAPDFTGVTSAACAAGQVTASFEELPYDLSFVCRELHDTAGRLAAFAEHVRGLSTGVMGHSLGGAAAVGAARIDQLFTTVLGLAPAQRADDAEPLADLVPSPTWMMMGGTADTLVSFTDWTQPFFEALPAPAFLVRVTDGTHGGFSDSDSRLTPEALAAQQDAVKRTATPFFLKFARKGKFGAVARSTTVRSRSPSDAMRPSPVTGAVSIGRATARLARAASVATTSTARSRSTWRTIRPGGRAIAARQT